jgi:hypothetical protein
MACMLTFQIIALFDVRRTHRTNYTNSFSLDPSSISLVFPFFRMIVLSIQRKGFLLINKHELIENALDSAL